MAASGKPALNQAIGPVQMAFYATGSMLGAGIYGLIGKAAGISGNAIWLSFAVALVAALLTGLSYASLGSRHPKAGGTAYIVERAFKSPGAGFVVGLMLACSAIIGIPTMAQVFAGFFVDLFALGDAVIPVVAAGFLLLLGLLIARGIRESMWLNILCCCMEALGLFIIIGTGISFWGSVDYLEVPVREATLFAGIDPLVVAVMSSTVLTFYAFIGFEDTLNVAEECKNPQRTLPMGILIAMGVVALLYIAVAFTAVSAVPWQTLATANTPLTEVIRVTAPAIPPVLFTIIALFAVTNTILVNFITASRLVYGMAQQKLLPAFLGRIHDTRRTPHIAVLVLFCCFMPFALFGTVAQLAGTSVLMLLSVFALMNISLVILQRREGEKRGKFEIHGIFPILGAAVCIILIVARVITGEWTAPALAGGMVAGILAVYAVTRKKRRKA